MLRAFSFDFQKHLRKVKQKTSDRLICCCSVAKLCLTLCNPMNCSMLGFPVLYISQSLLKLMSTESVLCALFLVLYVVAVLGNLTMIVVITLDAHLHSPIIS